MKTETQMIEEGDSMAENCINMIRERLTLKQCCLFNSKIEEARKLPRQERIFMLFAICKATRELLLKK